MSFRVSHAVVLFSFLLGSAACATPPTKISQENTVDEINNRGGLALKGYDPVAYFTDAKPVRGDPAIQYEWKGATYRFATPEHRALFQASPEHYAPQFGGYCAYAVSLGTTADGDPQQWALVSDRLYVNNNAIAAKLWGHDRLKNIRLGVSNWPLIPKQPLEQKASAAPPAEEPR
jgi:YHS domain-containing protein